MGAVFVVVADVLGEQPFHMTFIDRDDMVQHVPTATSHPALRDAILPWAFKGSLNRTDVEGANSGLDLQAVLCIAIEDQILGSRIKGKGLAQLLDDPQTGWMFGDVEVQNATAIVADNEEAVEYAEGDCGNREEIHRSDGFLVVTQKGQPAFGWIWVCGNSLHPARNGSFGDIKTEHQKFAVDAGSSPARVLGHHLEDEKALRSAAPAVNPSSPRIWTCTL